MPAVKKIEPEFEERIFRTVLLIQDEFDYFQGQAQAILNKKLLLGSILPAAAFAGLHPAQARHLAREYLRQLKGNLLGVGFEHIADFLQSLETGRGLSLPGLNLKFAKGWIFQEKTRIGDYRVDDRRRWALAHHGDRAYYHGEKSSPLPPAQRQFPYHGAGDARAISPACPPGMPHRQGTARSIRPTARASLK